MGELIVPEEENRELELLKYEMRTYQDYAESARFVWGCLTAVTFGLILLEWMIPFHKPLVIVSILAAIFTMYTSSVAEKAKNRYLVKRLELNRPASTKIWGNDVK